MFHHLLYPTDFSPASRLQLQALRQLASGLGARVTLLHVNNWLGDAVIGIYDLHEAGSLKATAASLEQSIRRHLGEMASTLAQDAIEVVVRIETGGPGPGIVSAAQATGCDLIVMSSHGLRPVSSALLGSVCRYVLHHSPVPVLILPEAGPEPAA